MSCSKPREGWKRAALEDYSRVRAGTSGGAQAARLPGRDRSETAARLTGRRSRPLPNEMCQQPRPEQPGFVWRGQRRIEFPHCVKSCLQAFSRRGSGNGGVDRREEAWHSRGKEVRQQTERPMPLRAIPARDAQPLAVSRVHDCRGEQNRSRLTNAGDSAANRQHTVLQRGPPQRPKAFVVESPGGPLNLWQTKISFRRDLAGVDAASRVILDVQPRRRADERHSVVGAADAMIMRTLKIRGTYRDTRTTLTQLYAQVRRHQ